MFALTEEKLSEMPILWESEDHKTRLVRNDERNLEILLFAHIGGEGKQGRKAVERDCWASIPCYCGSLQEAFFKLLDMHSKKVLEMSAKEGSEIGILLESMKEFRKSFSETVRRGV